MFSLFCMPYLLVTGRSSSTRPREDGADFVATRSIADDQFLLLNSAKRVSISFFAPCPLYSIYSNTRLSRPFFFFIFSSPHVDIALVLHCHDLTGSLHRSFHFPSVHSPLYYTMRVSIFLVHTGGILPPREFGLQTCYRNHPSSIPSETESQ